MRDARQLNPTTIHAWGYAYKLTGNAKYREQGDEVFASTFGKGQGPGADAYWGLADYQAKLVASFIVALASDAKHAAWFRKLKASATPDIGHGIPYKDTPWHKFEIHHYRFRKYMARLLRKFGASATAPLAGAAATQSAENASAKAPLRLAS